MTADSAFLPAAAILTIDRQQRSALLGGRRVALGGRAFDVLAVLTARPGQVCSVQSLHQAVWPDTPVEPNNLRVQIATLRQRLGPQHIDNVARRGYRWVGPVHEAGAAPGAALIGRDHELLTLRAMADQHRLVNVVGAGGIGKTSLVRAWRAGLPPRPGGAGAIMVELAPLALADAVLPAVAQALAPVLGTPVSATSLPALVAALGAATAPLPHLVLDNAEHLIDAVARLVQALLDGVPQLRIAVTSQVPLRLPGEQLLRLGPLELPERSVTLAQARALGALVLFAERVRALDPRFELNARNLATVADVCCRLDGLPLAIELAAARVPALGLQALQRALGERLGLLTGGPGHAPARQRTLRAALDWSYSLLDAPTQQVFCRLGTFTGPFTLAQAQRALAPSQAVYLDWSVVDAIGRLVDASLVGHDGGEPPRYQLLELPRAFALERLGLPQPVAVHDDAGGASPLLQRLVRQVSAGMGQDDSTGGSQTLDAQTVLALARRLQPDDLRQFDTALLELQRAVDLAASVVADGDDNDGDAAGGDTDHVLAAVAEQTRLGQLDRGADELDAALEELQRRDERRRTALRRAQHTLLEACVRQDLLRRDAPAVARRIESLVALAASGDDAARPSWAAGYIAHETRYLADGMQSGERLKLQVGVALARRRLETAASAAERLAVQRVLVRALREQGSRESTHTTLEEGVQLARQALQAISRAGAPLEWAALQHDLGSLLSTLSYRTGDIGMMEEAEACTRLALQERSQAHTPLDWADSQRQLAGTLRNLGQREASNHRVLEAAAACRAALLACPVALTPQLHAQLQDMLATTLIELGRRAVTATLLQEAVQAARHALAAISADHAAQLWGDCNSHLGIALGLLGEPELQPDEQLALRALQDAVIAFRHALSVASPDGDAVAYAMRLHNLAAVLRKLGVLESGRVGMQHLEQSASHSREAITHFVHERFPMYWAAAQEDLASTLQALAQRQRQAGDQGQALATLEQAAQAVSQALLERTRERSPLEWAQAVSNRASIWLDIGRFATSPNHVHEALVALDSALSVLTGDGAAVHRKQTLALMAQANDWLAARAAEPLP